MTIEYYGSQQPISSTIGGSANVYGNALQDNQQSYKDIIAGYQNVLNGQRNTQNNIISGYNNLSNQVLGGITHAGRSQAQAINDSYAQNYGQAQQGLINSGLGNTTVASSINRGLQFDKTKSQNALAEQVSQLRAGYQSNLGLASLSYQNQANMQNTALSGQQLGYQAGYQNLVTGAGLRQQEMLIGAQRGGGGGGSPGGGKGGGGGGRPGGGYSGAYADPNAGYDPNGSQAYFDQYQRDHANAGGVDMGPVNDWQDANGNWVRSYGYGAGGMTIQGNTGGIYSSPFQNYGGQGDDQYGPYTGGSGGMSVSSGTSYNDGGGDSGGDSGGDDYEGD